MSSQHSSSVALFDSPDKETPNVIVEVINRSDDNLQKKDNREIACVLCLHVFMKVNGFKNHVRSACPEIGAIKCWNCMTTFDTQVDLRSHWLSEGGKCIAVVTKEEELFNCEHCPRKFSDEACKNKHTEDCHCIGIFECSECSKHFCYRYLLHAHEKDVHLINSRKYCCNVCGEQFVKLFHLQKHVMWHKLNFNGDEASNSTGYSGSPIAKPHELVGFVCDVCDRLFFTQTKLDNHKAAAHGIGKSTLVCDVCNRSFGTQQNLKTHRRTHTKEKPFACRVCHRAFSQHTNRRRHELTHGKTR